MAEPDQKEEDDDPFGLVGTVLDGKFPVSRVVAEGGFGVVYFATHGTLDVPVALKVLKTPVTVNEAVRTEFIATFAREARIIARLRHPNVVQVLDYGVSPAPSGAQIPWMALEWLDGQTLEHLLTARRGRGLGPADALALLRPVFDAVACAHNAGVAHRDLKPGNIMLANGPHGPTAKLMDFGIAKFMDEGEFVGSHTTRTHSALRAFSRQYAAPEQITSRGTGPWTDVHALGLILTEVLTGIRAYPQDDPAETLGAALSTTRPTPQQYFIDVGAWEPVLAKALALNPKDRYRNAGDFLTALEAGVPNSASTLDTSVPWAVSVRLEHTVRPSRPPQQRTPTVRQSDQPLELTSREAVQPSPRRWRKTVGTLGTLAALGVAVALGSALRLRGSSRLPPRAARTAPVVETVVRTPLSTSCHGEPCNGILEISTGTDHSCARRADGTVLCWGGNNQGQLGNGTTTLSTHPVAVIGLRDAKSLRSGDAHTCALRNDGTIACWGRNKFGQLGDGTSGADADRTTPITVLGLNDAIGVAVGDSHSCGLRRNHQIVCWGHNGRGQLGNGESGAGTDRAAPVPVIGINDAIAITSGSMHACALRAGGTISCWGGNYQGQLGDNTTIYRTRPVLVLGITDAVAVTAGDYHTCARRATGTIMCWGGNYQGQLGDGTTTDRAAPVPVLGIDDAVGNVRAGTNHTCVLRKSGVVSCWGNNDFGQLGDGTTENRKSAVNVQGLSDAVEVRVGSYHTCARRSTGPVMCWGHNSLGQLGDGTTTDRIAPTLVQGLD